MDGRYHRALAIGLLFGILMTCFNLFAYLWYNNQTGNDGTVEAGGNIANLCIGADTGLYLLILTAVVYMAGGICSVVYACRYLERRRHAARAGMITGVVVAAMSVPAAGLLIESGIFSTHTSCGWVLIYVIYALGGIFLSLEAGALCFDRMAKKAGKSPE